MTLLTASCGDLVAVLSDDKISHDRLSIPLYQCSSQDLQATLTTSIGNHQQDVVSVLKLWMPSASYCCCLLSNSKIIVWSMERGVVLYTINGDEEELKFCDVISVNEKEPSLLHVLLKKTGKDKFYVYEYNLGTGKCVRRIKCGSLHSNQSSVGLAVTSLQRLVVRQGNLMKVLNLETGSKVGKMKLASSEDGGGGMSVSNDGALVAVGTGAGVTVFDVESQEVVASVHVSHPAEQVSLVKLQDDDDDDKYALLVQASAASALYEFTPTAKNKEPLTPACRFSSTDVSSFSLHFAAQPKQVVAIFKSKGRVQVRPLTCQNEDGTRVESVRVDAATNKEEDATVTSPKKRTLTTTLGPGQAGGEALQLTEGPNSKKKRTSDEEKEEELTEKEQSIAERLQRLSDAMNDEEDDDEPSSPATDFHPKRATTESLAHLVRQALMSGDEGMLELALSVRDRSVIQKSLQELEEAHVGPLLVKLTTRLAYKPNRAAELAVWLQCILLSGKVRQPSQLWPLRNLVQERTESFPHLLRLEGRLSVLGSR